MKRNIYTGIILSILFLCFGSFGIVGAQNASDTLPIINLVASSTTSPVQPAGYLVDGRPETYWGFTDGASQAWVEMTLEEASLIHGIKLVGTLGLETKLVVEYQQQGQWIPFTAASIAELRDNQPWIDLSYDQAVTDHLRLRLWGAGITQTQLTELQVVGEVASEIRYQIYPTAVQGSTLTNPNYPVQFLADDNTQTMWLVDNYSSKKQPAADLGEAVYTFDQPYQLQNLNLYLTDQVQGDLQVEIKQDTTWQVVETVYQGAEVGWYRIALPGQPSTDQVRVTVRGFTDHLGGISEVQFWGAGSYPGKETKLVGLQRATSLQQVSNRQFTLDPEQLQDYYLELVLEDGTDQSLQLELNGQALEVEPGFRLRGHTVYRQLIPAESFWAGLNFVAIQPLSSGEPGTLLSTKLIAPHQMGQVGHSLAGLNDGWFLTPNQLIQEEIQLDQPTLVEEVRIFTQANNTYFNLYAWRDGGWVEVGPVSQRPQGVGFVGPFETDRLRIENLSGFAVGEVLVLGSQTRDQAPTVEILSPQMGEVIDQKKVGQMELVGFVDDPTAKIMINGVKVIPEGHYFTTKLVKVGVEPWEVSTITATATDQQGRVGSDQVQIYCGERPLMTVDQPDELVYTEEDQFQLSGLVLRPEGQLTINGVAVDYEQPKGSYTTNVALEAGFNLLEIKYVIEDVDSDKIFQSTMYRKVLRYGGEPVLAIDTPVTNFYTQDPSIIVTGFVDGLGDLTVTVNGYQATLDGAFYTSPAIPLLEGSNTIQVEATDGKRTVSKQVEVVRDTMAPALQEILPEEGYLSATDTIQVSGQVIDPSPTLIYINGDAVPVDGQSFADAVTYPDGSWTVTIEAVDQAGNRAEQQINLMVDTTLPEPFEVQIDPEVWTNNTRPEITFATTDVTSGVEYYQLAIDDGGFERITSPYQLPELADGEHQIRVQAVDRAGWVREATTTALIDTTAPILPEYMRVIPGNGKMIVKWDPSSEDVIEYRITREPAGAEPVYVVEGTEFVDYEVQNGETVSYRVWAVDRAYNESPKTEWKAGTTGVAEAEYIPGEGSIVEYDGVSLVIPKVGVPEGIEKIEITEVESEVLEEKIIYPMVSPIYEFSAYKEGSLTPEENLALDQGYIGQIEYDQSLVPEGFPEQNLGVYHYDPMFDKWFLIPSAGIDIENNVIYFLTNHFSSFSVQATVVQDLSPQEYKDAGYSPLKTYAEHGQIRVSPQGGTASTEATELVLPGKNGFDFVLKRRYDTATARNDAFALAINIHMGFNLTGPSGDTKDVGEAVDQASNLDKIKEWMAGQVGENVKQMIEKYLLNQGDYAYSMGQGWRLNLPYVRSANSSLYLVTSEGAMHSINEMKLSEIPVFHPYYREMRFEQHQGTDFTLIVKQVKGDAEMAKLVGNDFVKTRWMGVGYTLILKDGTKYELDALGRTTKIIDPTGLNEINLHYSGLYLDYIEDSMGRKVHFSYGESGGMWDRIDKIWVEDDPYDREITYTLEDALLKEAKDAGGRISKYEYDLKCLYGGSAGIKINILTMVAKLVGGPIAGAAGSLIGANDVELFGNFQAQFVFPMVRMEAPGQGITKLQYQRNTFMYGNAEVEFFLLVPISATLSVNLEQRMLANQVEVFLEEEDADPLTTDYTYQFEDYTNVGAGIFGRNYIKSTIEDDEKRKTIYYYSPVEKVMMRWEDRSYANNGLLDAFPAVVLSKYILPLNDTIEIYDAATDDLLEKQTMIYDTNTIRPTTTTTWHGENYRRQTYTYDNWGNPTYIWDYSVANGRVNQTKSWMYYLNTDSGQSPNVSWQPNPYADQSSVSLRRRNLLVGNVTANYIPTENGSSTVQYLHSYQKYNTIGQMVGKAQWNGREWLKTEFTYDPQTGYLKQKKDAADHITSFGYDEHGFLTTTTEEDVKDVQGRTTDIVTQKGYEYYSGWVLWEKNPRGFVTEYEYDALGRIIKIIAPNDDDTEHLDWIPDGVTPDFRNDNPSSTVAYDDVALTSVVTDALNNQIKYEFDPLGRMSKLTKYQRNEVGSYVPRAVTTLSYDKWGNIISITDPNGHDTGELWKYTTHYEFDALGRNIAIISPDNTVALDDNPKKIFKYDDSNNILEVWDERETKVTQYLDMQGRVVLQSILDDDDRLIETKTYYDGLGNQVISVDPNGNKTINEYNEMNLLEKVILPSEDFWENEQPVTVSPYQRYEYNNVGQKVKEVVSSPGGGEHETVLLPDALGRIIRTTTTVTDLDGQGATIVTENYYDANGNVVEVVDGNNTSLLYEAQKSMKYTYSAQDKLLTETDAAGNITSYTYDALGNRLSMTDPRGNSYDGEEKKYAGDFTIIYHYDDLNRLVRAELPKAPGASEEAEKPEVVLNYDARGNLIERIEPDGGKVSYTYYPRNWVHTETVEGDDGSFTKEYFYDKGGNQIKIKDSLGKETIQNYDSLNRLVSVKHPELNQEFFKYDKLGNRTAVIDGEENRTDYRYNNYGQLVQVIDAKIKSTYYKYDRLGNMTRKINAMDHVTKYKYDELNRLVEEMDSQGHITRYGYDLAGNRDYSLDPNGTVGAYEYYANNLLKKMTLTNGEIVQTVEYSYDEAGNLIESNNDDVVTKYNTFAGTYRPDPFGRIWKIEKVIDGNIFEVEYSYDVMGRVTGVKSPTGNWVNYNYNNLGQLTQVPGYINQAPTYDERGLMTSLTAANGITTNWSYDDNGRLTDLDYQNQSVLVKGYDLTYDDANNIIEKNNDTFTYDELNQLVFANLKGKFENDPAEEGQAALRATLDYAGQNSLEVVADQSQIIELDYAAGSIGVDLKATVSVTRVELSPDSPIHRVDADNLELYYSLDNYTYTRVEDWELVKKKHGKLMLVVDTPVSARYIKVKNYYDDRDASFNPIRSASEFLNTPDKLIQVYYYVGSRTENYEYNGIGGREKETITQRTAKTRGYSYYANSNLLKSNDKYGYIYDNNGNLIKKGENPTIIEDEVTVERGNGEYWEYEYDLFSRLRKVIKPVESGTEVIEYVYDESGLRLKKESTTYQVDEDLTMEKTPDQVIYYIFGQNGEVLYEQEDQQYMEYVYVLGSHFARVNGILGIGDLAKYFYHTDYLGSAILVTDESGETVWGCEYTPFGQIAMEEGILAKAAKFTGKDLDEDTGLYYYNARWYDQGVGRFISKDSFKGEFENPQSHNLYGYVINNPLKYNDPTGHHYAGGLSIQYPEDYDPAEHSLENSVKKVNESLRNNYGDEPLLNWQAELSSNIYDRMVEAIKAGNYNQEVHSQIYNEEVRKLQQKYFPIHNGFAVLLRDRIIKDELKPLYEVETREFPEVVKAFGRGFSLGLSEGIGYGVDLIANDFKYSMSSSILGEEVGYQYNMIENPGPLAEISGNPASNFAGGKYNVIILEEETILYRAGKPGGGRNALGQWFTDVPAESVAKVRIDSAVKPQWIDPVTGKLTGESPIGANYAVKIPANTVIYQGPVGYQGGIYLGGQDQMQIFIQEPWFIEGVEAVSETPLF